MLAWVLAVTLAGLLLATPTIPLAITNWSSSSFCCGVLAALLVARIPWLVQPLRKSGTDTSRDGAIYGIDHGILHLMVPPKSWWMNMGYWIDQKQPNNLSEACRALLWKVLNEADLLSTSMSSSTPSDSMGPLIDDLRILDVGFGCGDQTLAICNSSNNLSYIGITLDQQQFRFARDRGLENVFKDKERSNNIRLFQADAAKPELWHTSLKTALEMQFHRGPVRSNRAEPLNWLLALDTLYHFKPSREPLFVYAHNQLHASVMAFDLLLSDQSHTWLQLLFLRLSCMLSSTPYTNFLTVRKYRQLLVSVGYQEEDIRIVDISQHVFNPLADFLEHQDQHLKMLGLSIGKFRAAKMLFSWWGRSGIVRGCVVIAKRRLEKV